MSRMSQRVSGMWSTVKCPRCHAAVPIPEPAPPPADPAGAEPPSDGGQRWSFVWRMPRGDFCPDCDFPLSKYFGRLKWIRLTMVGVTIVFVALVLQIVGVFGRFSAEYLDVMKLVLRIGFVVFVVGAIGVTVGGKRAARG